jgi:hypothetical protein
MRPGLTPLGLAPWGLAPLGQASFRFSSQKVRSAELGGGGRTDQIGPYGNGS